MMLPHVIFPEGMECAHSGLRPLARDLPMESVYCRTTYRAAMNRSWTVGHALQQWGIRRYGSTWNALLPGWDEARILRRLPNRAEPYPVHFIFGEFVAPKRPEPYRRKGGRVVVSVHCSASRWDRVWLRPDGYARADQVVLTSESQRPLVARHVQDERIARILLGVDVKYFRPPASRRAPGEKLRLLLMGNTERDHEFAAKVAKRLPPEKFEWRVRTVSHEKSAYAGVPCVNLLPRLSDEEFLREYQAADVLAMPMLDSAANDVILESMACGTPVMVNRVGGVPEYVDPACNFVMSNDRNVDEWIEKLLWLEENRDVLEQMRPATRTWAEKFDWKIIAEQYRAMYRDVLARG